MIKLKTRFYNPLLIRYVTGIYEGDVRKVFKIFYGSPDSDDAVLIRQEKEQSVEAFEAEHQVFIEALSKALLRQ